MGTTGLFIPSPTPTARIDRDLGALILDLIRQPIWTHVDRVREFRREIEGLRWKSPPPPINRKSLKALHDQRKACRNTDSGPKRQEIWNLKLAEGRKARIAHLLSGFWRGRQYRQIEGTTEWSALHAFGGLSLKSELIRMLHAVLSQLPLSRKFVRIELEEYVQKWLAGQDTIGALKDRIRLAEGEVPVSEKRRQQLLDLLGETASVTVTPAPPAPLDARSEPVAERERPVLRLAVLPLRLVRGGLDRLIGMLER